MAGRLKRLARAALGGRRRSALGGRQRAALGGRQRAALGGRQRAALVALAVGVLAVHGCVTREILMNMSDASAALAMPPRIEVAYVRDMDLSTPPPAAAPAAPPPTAPPRAARTPRVKAPAPKASDPAPADAAETAEAAETTEATEATDNTGVGDSLAMGNPLPENPPPSAAPPASPPVTPPITPPITPPAPPSLAALAAIAASGNSARLAAAAAVASAAAASVAASAGTAATAAAGAASGAAPTAFEWPTSTRISYVLTGNYRGEVSGSAQVEWVRVGSRYQVHLDLIVGPSSAPLITRRMTSDGEITAQGLAPRSYDQDTKVILQDRRRVTLQFEPGSVVLANGERRDSVLGVQDTASQFVQLTYVFSTRAEALKVGDTVDIPLALPHKVDVWTYEVADEETLQASFGPLPTIHLKPKRKADRRAGEMSAEIWLAPQLRYLPVRIRIEQDEGTFVDLMIARRPEIAGP